MKNMVNLMYHDVVLESDKSSGFCHDGAFQYKVLKGDFAEHLEQTADDDVCWTFDDGGLSALTEAAPMLEAKGLKGVFFIATKYIGTKGFLSEEDIRELDRRGHVIGSHSHTHPENLTRLSKEELQDEWQTSVDILERILGKKVTVASVPNGYDNKDVFEAAYHAGIRTIYTSTPTNKEEQKYGLSIRGRYAVDNRMRTADMLGIVRDSSIRKRLYYRWCLLNVIKFFLGGYYEKIKAVFIK